MMPNEAEVRAHAAYATERRLFAGGQSEAAHVAATRKRLKKEVHERREMFRQYGGDGAEVEMLRAELALERFEKAHPKP